MALQAKVGRAGVSHVVLEEYPEGIYVFVFERPDSPHPYRDYLQDTWDMAKGFCEDEYGIPESGWNQIPDPRLR
jgi:hypothetical protein